ncbi:phage holin [Laceyella putida]|uniref:Phage holin n=1 Tax=Laceyella putida TaxID=110101 RepID=A0ABW2RHG9_9BACL
MNLMKRLGNWGFIASSVAFAALVARLFGVEFVGEDVQTTVDVVLSILVALGLINDPTTNNKGYLDDPST